MLENDSWDSMVEEMRRKATAQNWEASGLGDFARKHFGEEKAELEKQDMIEKLHGPAPDPESLCLFAIARILEMDRKKWQKIRLIEDELEHFHKMKIASVATRLDIDKTKFFEGHPE